MDLAVGDKLITLDASNGSIFQQVAHAKELVAEGKAKREVARLFKVSPATLYRALAA